MRKMDLGCPEGLKQLRRGAARCALGLLLAALALSTGQPAGAAGNAAGPGRIAVGGAFPSGYVGLLARNGLPRDIVLDYQLADPEFLCRYDTLIMAGVSPEGARHLLAGLDRFLSKGGNLLLDYSAATGFIMDWLLAVRGRGTGGPARIQRTTAGFRLAGANNPLRGDVGSEDTFPSTRLGFVPPMADPGRATILAEYLQPREKMPRKLQRREGADEADKQAPAGSPAIVLEQRGKGKILQCGPALGMGIALAGMECDRLILGMLRILSDGRVAPQLTPEGVRLARKQSSRSKNRKIVKEEQPEEPAPLTVPDRPSGPGARGTLPKGFSLIEADAATEYNLSGQLAGAEGEVLLNYWSGASHVRVRLSPSGIRVTRVVGGRPKTLAATAAVVPATVPFVIKERSCTLMVVAGTAVLTASVAGLHGGSTACRGARGEVRYQPVEPPAFSDDFMRTSDDPGGWETHGGVWKTAPVQNPDMGANPFSYKVVAGTDPATSIAGYPYWDDYRFSVSVRPEAMGGRIGMGLYAQDADNMLLFQARVLETDQPAEDGFRLVRVSGGQTQVLAQQRGGLRARQWYRAQVKAAGPWIGVTIDGEKVLGARDTTFAGGMIALSAEAATTRFDDVLVEPSSTVAGSGRRLVGKIPEWAGIIDVDSWAGPATPWEAHPQAPGLFWHRGAFYGDVGMRFEVPPLPANGKALILVDGDGDSIGSGYAVTLARQGTGGVLELSHGGEVLSRTPLPGGGSVVIGLRREGNHVVGLVDGRVVARAPYALGTGLGRLAFQALGFQPRISDLAVWTAKMGDYTFDTAPVDWWVASGEWDVTNRWSCTPDWSWFGGTSDGVAAIWYKRPFQGNLLLDFYAGPKMLSGGKRKKESLADFNAAICGDGVDVKSGYSFVVAENGSGARILRQGQVVAENKGFRLFTQGHNRWANVRVEKHGGRLRLFVEGQVVVEYRDPQPLPGGYAGVWTQDNGIMVPRVTLYYEALGTRCLSLL